MASSDIIAPNLWDIARKRLTNTEEAQLAKAAVDNNTLSQQLLELVQRKQQECMDRRWKFKRSNGEVVIIRDVFERVVRWLQRFKEVGDVAIQYDPTHAALPWAGVRMLLQISVNDTESLGAIAEGIETISRLITRCAILESIHLAPHFHPLTKAQAMLQDALVSLYTAILAWLSVAGLYYDRRTMQRLLRSVASSGPTLTSITQEERKVSQLAASLQDQLASATAGTVESLNVNLNSLLGMLRDMEQPIARAVGTLNRIERNLEAKDRKQLVRWLSVVRHQHAHQKVHRGLIANTGEWLLRRTEYIEWCESRTSSTLWLHGIPGCGKSKLASLVIQKHLDYLSGNTNAAPLAYYYCSRTGFDGTQPKTDPLMILRSVLKQLALSGPDGGVHHSVWDEYSSRAEDAKEDGLDPTPLSLDECERLIISITSDYPATVIVDGLDEADGDTRHLLNAFQHIIEESRSAVKLFISCRDDEKTPVATHLSNVTEISVRRADNAGDVSAFVDKIVSESVDSKRLLRGRVSQELQNLIREKLVQTSDTMFLWAHLHLEQLCDPKFALEADVIQEVKALRTPKGLMDILDPMYARVQRYPPRAKDITKSIFGWLIISERQLSRSQLLDAISFSQTNGRYELRTEPLSQDSIRDLCRGFIDFTADPDTFTFTHESVREYILGFEEFHPSNLSHFAFSQCLKFLSTEYTKINDMQLTAPHELMGGLSRKRHRSPDVIENEGEENITSPFWSYSVIYWPYHYMKIGSTELRQKADLEVLQFVFAHEGSFFLVWQRDVLRAVKQRAEERSKATTDLLEKLTSLKTSRQSAIFVGSMYGITAILENLEKEQVNIDWNATNNYRLTGTYLCAAYGHSNSLEFLLARGASPDKTVLGYETPVQAAAFHGHDLAITILLDYNADPLAEASFPTALHAAIAGGHESSMGILVEKDSCHTRGDLGGLVTAASYDGYHGVVDALLRRYFPTQVIMSEMMEEAISGANDAFQTALYMGIKNEPIPRLLNNMSSEEINATGGLFGNALQAASFGGATHWVLALLERGADANVLSISGSPLRAASLGGHDAVVRLLLNHGAYLGPDGRDALEACALKDHLSTLKFLIQAFALDSTFSLDTSKHCFNAAIRTAQRKGHNRIVDLLLENGAGLSQYGQLIAANKKNTDSPKERVNFRKKGTLTISPTKQTMDARKATVISRSSPPSAPNPMLDIFIEEPLEDMDILRGGSGHSRP